MEVIKLSATWCQPCKAYKPEFEKCSQLNWPNDIKFKEIDIDSDEADDIVNEYSIRSIPTTLFIDTDINTGMKKLLISKVGILSCKQLEDTINNLLMQDTAR